LAETLEAGPAVAERRRLGLAVAAGHTWEASAEGHMAAYRWAAARSAFSPPGARAGRR
jgi:hypothetical protein